MFWIRIGNLVASIALAFGAFRVAMGIFVAMADDPTARAAMTSRYLGSASSGDAIDQGLMVVVGAIVLGLLVTIARAASER